MTEKMGVANQITRVLEGSKIRYQIAMSNNEVYVSPSLPAGFPLNYGERVVLNNLMSQGRRTAEGIVLTAKQSTLRGVLTSDELLTLSGAAVALTVGAIIEDRDRNQSGLVVSGALCEVTTGVVRQLYEMAGIDSKVEPMGILSEDLEKSRTVTTKIVERTYNGMVDHLRREGAFIPRIVTTFRG